MKLLPALLVLAALGLSGCANRPVTHASEVSPAGTDVGTSFPGVNQPTTNTTATRSDNPTPEPSNTAR